MNCQAAFTALRLAAEAGRRLKASEHVLLEWFALRVIEQGSCRVDGSKRQIARDTGLAEMSVLSAVRGLSDLRLIRVADEGGPLQARVFEVVLLASLFPAEGAVQNLDQGVVQNLDHPPVEDSSASVENPEVNRAVQNLDHLSNSKGLVVLENSVSSFENSKANEPQKPPRKAKPKTPPRAFAPEVIAHVHQVLLGFQPCLSKRLEDEHNSVAAQCLEIAASYEVDPAGLCQVLVDAEARVRAQNYPRKRHWGWTYRVTHNGCQEIVRQREEAARQAAVDEAFRQRNGGADFPARIQPRAERGGFSSARDILSALKAGGQA